MFILKWFLNKRYVSISIIHIVYVHIYGLNCGIRKIGKFLCRNTNTINKYYLRIFLYSENFEYKIIVYKIIDNKSFVTKFAY